MAEIVLKIPKEFEQDFNTDRFKECFKRVLFDCKAWDYAGISGNYEHETLKMLLDAFNEAVVLPKKHGRIGDLDAIKKDMQNYHDDCAKTSEYTRLGFETAIAVVEDANAIIEADKEEENENIS